MDNNKEIHVNTGTEQHQHTKRYKKRESWIDYTKLFACLLIVIGHLLQGLNKANITWNENFYYYIDKFIYIFHMPLFMCLSGYLYIKYTEINNKKDYVEFIKKKLLNLGIPYVIFYLAYVAINMFFSKSVNSQKGIQDILNILTNPIAPFWFLYVLFFIFLFIPIIEYKAKNKTKILIPIFIIFHIFSIFFSVHIYAINNFMYYIFYFYIGILFINNRLDKINSKKIVINIILFFIFSIFYCYIYSKEIFKYKIMDLIKFPLSTYGVFVSIIVFKKFYKKLENNRVCKYISKYTFPIYLMHTTFSAGIRIALLKIGINNFYIQFLFGIIFGVIGPIIVAKLLEKSKYGNIILYPVSTIDKLKKYKKNRKVEVA